MAEIRPSKKQQLGETLQVLRVGDWFLWAFKVPGKGWKTTTPFPAISRNAIVLTEDDLDSLSEVLAQAMASWRGTLRAMLAQEVAGQLGEPPSTVKSYTQEAA